MKKLLLLLLMVLGLAAFAPKAEAGQFARVYTRHGVTYVHKSALYGGNCHNNFRHHRNRGFGWHPYRTHRTVRHFPVYRNQPRFFSPGFHCANQPRFFAPVSRCAPGPRFAVSFGF